MRKLEDWLRAYLEMTKAQESPEYYHVWCGMSVLAGALGRSVRLDRTMYILFPNLYIVLIGPSARTRKSTAIDIAKVILKKALEHPAVMAQRLNPESLIEALIEEFDEHGEGRGHVMSREFSNFLRGDPNIVELLTDLYDSQVDSYTYRTIGRGKRVVENPLLNLLGGSTAEYFRSAIPVDTIGGGFTSRIIFVYQTEMRHRTAFIEPTKEMWGLHRDLVHDLKEINKLTGDYKLSDNAKEWFRHWYEEVLVLQSRSELDGYYGRKHDTLLKVCMSLSASRGDSLEITEEDMKIGLSLLNENEKRLPDAMDVVQTTPQGRLIGKVRAAIERKETLSHSQLLQRLSYCARADELKEVIAHLKGANQIESFVENGKKYYRKVK